MGLEYRSHCFFSAYCKVHAPCVHAFQRSPAGDAGSIGDDMQAADSGLPDRVVAGWRGGVDMIGM